MYHIFIEIKGNIDSFKLWDAIKGYKLNLTDLGEINLIYGEIALQYIGELISLCASYGMIHADVKGGVSNEQKEES